MLPATDRVLLRNEWLHGACPECGVLRSDADGIHATGCEWDLAIAERGFDTVEERDRVRKYLTASAPTIAPPSSSTP